MAPHYYCGASVHKLPFEEIALTENYRMLDRALQINALLRAYNPQRDAPYATPSDDTIQRFLQRLRSRGIFVKRRVTQGRDLMGACGQLGNPEVRRPR